MYFIVNEASPILLIKRPTLEGDFFFDLGLRLISRLWSFLFSLIILEKFGKHCIFVSNDNFFRLGVSNLIIGVFLEQIYCVLQNIHLTLEQRDKSIRNISKNAAHNELDNKMRNKDDKKHRQAIYRELFFETCRSVGHRGTIQQDRKVATELQQKHKVANGFFSLRNGSLELDHYLVFISLQFYKIPNKPQQKSDRLIDSKEDQQRKLSYDFHILINSTIDVTIIVRLQSTLFFYVFVDLWMKGGRVSLFLIV